jgi:methionine synthase I (cobalamin-dependent)
MATPAWPTSERVIGLQGNASCLSLEDRNRLDHIDGSEPDDFADLMAGLHSQGMKIVGGCCGTNPAHLHALARRLSAKNSR